MSNRTSPFILVGAVGGCLVLALCGVVAVGAFLLISGNTTLVASTTAPSPLNRIVFVGNDANIYTADPVTGDATALTQDGGTEHGYSYPTWSPDNRHLAFVGITIKNGDATEGVLFSAAPDGKSLTPVYKTNANFPFYLYWSPDSQFITFLTSKDDNTLALRVAKSDQPDSMQEVDSGNPFYFAWSPDASRLFTHVGGTRSDSAEARLALLPFKTQDARKSLTNAPGSFQAPQWSQDGKILFSTQDTNGEALAISNTDGNDIKTLVNYRGRVSFALSPDGTQLAYIVTDPQLRLPHYGKVNVVDTQGGNPRVASEENALAFLWSPDSKRLAYLTVTVGENQSNYHFDLHQLELASLRPDSALPSVLQEQQGDQQLQLHWKTWDLVTGERHELAAFVPTASFLNVIPYFDQYALSSTFWSPDSQSFVYTQRSTETSGLVYVADASGKSPARKIGEGLIAFWSWK